MTIHTPPWCLHWDRDGELAVGDRQDLLITLVVREHERAPGGIPPGPEFRCVFNEQALPMGTRP